MERLGEPYGNCTNITGYDWGNLYSGYKYTRTVSFTSVSVIAQLSVVCVPWRWCSVCGGVVCAVVV